MPGAVPFEEGWAIELGGERPSWFTPELEQRVYAAAGQPVPAPNDAPLPSVVGIRPGAWMVSPAGCTMNFAFAKSGSYAIGTALKIKYLRHAALPPPAHGIDALPLVRQAGRGQR